MLRDYVTSETGAYMNSPVALDKAMNYNVDGVYLGASYRQSGVWKGSLYKITVSQQGLEFDPLSTDYKDDPLDWDSMVKIFKSPAPLTAPFTLSIDTRDNCWIFCGTGRYIAEADKTTTDQNYIFGIKDPFFNPDNSTCYGKYGAGCTLSFSDLFDANIYTVKSSGVVEGDASVSNYTELVEKAREDIYRGWYRKLCPHALGADGICLGSGPSERVLSKPAILGGILLVPTFSPNSDICGYGGRGRLFAIYYETGTAYKRQIIGDKGQETIMDVISLGEGLSSSFGIHVGQEEGATVYGHLSTGVIKQIQVNVSGHTSAPIYWKEE
jgi:type IV pilus assembly protein PilY1